MAAFERSCGRSSVRWQRRSVQRNSGGPPLRAARAPGSARSGQLVPGELVMRLVGVPRKGSCGEVLEPATSGAVGAGDDCAQEAALVGADVLLGTPSEAVP